MIPEEVYDYTEEQLIDWLRYEAGSSNPDYFKAVKPGGLKLQQVPEEYAELLLLLKAHKPMSYLELGIGNGGSFAAACFFMKQTLRMAIAVDCLAYRNLNIGQCEEEINNFVYFISTFNQIENYSGRKLPETKAFFINKTTDEFFNERPADAKYNAIFIDADHSYEGVSKDFNNAQKHISDGGLIIFHDIASKACPGIIRIWSDVKNKYQGRTLEFVHSDTCGIGVLKF